jgi:DNA gyrase subunit A
VRGIKLAASDEVNSLAVLRHVDADVATRAAFLRASAARRRNAGYEDEAAEVTSESAVEAPEPVEAADADEDTAAEVSLSAERLLDLEASEEILLTVTNGGFGKRSSAYDYRVTGRGGQGITNIMLAPRNGTEVVATLPVRRGDDVMLVTDAGRLIRVPADQVRITARQTMGVTLFRLSEGERVTSIFPVLEVAAVAGEDDPDTETDPDGGEPRDA